MKFKVVSIAQTDGMFGKVTNNELESVCGKYKASVIGNRYKIGQIVDHYHISALERVTDRLKLIGINVEFASNYPWVYLYSVNGVKVNEKKNARHGYCVTYATRPHIILFRKDLFNKIRQIIEESK